MVSPLKTCFTRWRMLVSRWCAIVVVGAGVSSKCVANDEWWIATGFDYSVGDYGTNDDYKFLTLPLIFTYKNPRWNVEVTVPWAQFTGPANSLIVGGVVIVPGGNGMENTESGLGDIKAEITYATNWLPEGFGYLNLFSEIKFPTADEDKNLGTGKLDYSLECHYFRTFGRFTPMAFIAYQVRGDPSGTELTDVLNLSAGLNYQASDSLNLGFIYEYQEPNSIWEESYRDIEGYLTYQFNERWKLILYADKGLSDSAPDYSGGLELHYRF